MRIKRTSYCFIATFILSWIFLLYFTFANRPVNVTVAGNGGGGGGVVVDLGNEGIIDNNLQKLEEGIDREFKRNKDMLNNLHRYLDSRKRVAEKEEMVVVVDGGNGNGGKAKKGIVIPVLVFACNRVSVSRCLDQLIQYRPDPDQFPIIVSQDCEHPETTEVINRYVPQVSLIRQPDQKEIEVPPKEKKFKGYFKIARHYGWALSEIFFNFNFDAVIIVEDDLDIAPDFFEYFLGTYPLLQKDPTLWCISAWNDNGKTGLIDPKAADVLYRTDFFPGLGWMMLKSLWTELQPKWPKSYWDDWIRQPQQRKERACIRPEISRTRTFGKIGVSNGLFFEKHLKYIKLNEQFVPFTKTNLSNLTRDAYDDQFMRKVYQSPVVSYQELKEGRVARDGPVRIVYYNKDAFKRTAKLLGLMDDFRSGVPRTAYRGVISFSYKERPVFLAPNLNWKGYDLGWS